MKYLSQLQLHEVLAKLLRYNMFFSTTFLVLKKNEIPIGSVKQLTLDAENRLFLRQHYKIHPESNYFFRVMRQNNLKKDWLKPNYASTGLQSINTQTFRDAIIHEPTDNRWGWSQDYVEQLVNRLPRGQKIPLFHLAAWLYKDEHWADEASRSDIQNQMIEEYRLTEKELDLLFETLDSSLNEEQAFQDSTIDWIDFLESFSVPPDVPLSTSGILTYLETRDVGPAPHLEMYPSERLNLLTGDNGLGKTFVLDLSWWALTGDWVEQPATPFRLPSVQRPQIRYSVERRSAMRPITAVYSYPRRAWSIDDNQPTLSGLVVYARLDGSFAIWDPMNHALSHSQSGGYRWPGLKFTRDEVWHGSNFIEGLIRDWTRWQQRPDLFPAFDTFRSILSHVYPPDLGELTIAEPVRLPGIPREIPALSHPYGDVPILYESAGVRRIITLAYLLAWVWNQHVIEANLQGRPQEGQMVVLVDEIEAHLHPKWQRMILPGLMEVGNDLHSELSVQWIIASHSPLILASAESTWDPELDRLFHLDMNNEGKVTFEAAEFFKRGTVDSWLSSEVFDIAQPGSIGREESIRIALALQTKDQATPSEVQEVTDQLKQNLPDEDPFWVRWIFFAEAFGVHL